MSGRQNNVNRPHLPFPSLLPIPFPPLQPPPPSTLLQSAPRQLYSDAVKINDKIVIPHLMSLSFNNNSTKSAPTVHDHDHDIKAKVKAIAEAMKELETKYALAKMHNDAGLKSRCNTLVDETNDNIICLENKLRYVETADQQSLNQFLTDTHNALQNVTIPGPS